MIGIRLLPAICGFAATAAFAAQTEYPPETHASPVPDRADLPLTEGPFQGTVDSLKQYKFPDWFRDGKFGIWAHWGPQAVPGEGDWYARRMYEQGDGGYEAHLKVYGHPSKAGYKDIIPLWKAEKWDPEHLMALYKAAGAHYFVAQAVHHDNFDNWNSKYHKWNSVNMGPHKDMVGLWQKAAQAQGLRFGVSEHLGASFTWFQVSHKSDKTGPLAGVPYDGADPAYWDLYHLPTKPGDDVGYFYRYINDPRWINEWYARVYDLIDQYKPDLLYSDGGLPFQEVGRTIVAQLYNTSIKNNGGQLQAVYTCKTQGTGEFTPGTCVLDVERGGMNDIQPYPWQTDTSTGDWFYNKHAGYKSSGEVIHTLTDIVSKNGNLLLNVVQYPDGSLPPEMETFLSEMADWMKVNGEAIFGTRPWTIFGEGPESGNKQGAFNDNVPFTSRDIRFTRKGDDIYASVLGLPSGHVVIRALAVGSPLVTGDPTQVTLLGASGPVKWSRTANGLQIELPDTLPCKSEISFKISGLTTVADVPQDVLASFKESLGQPTAIQADADGSFQLGCEAATLQGSTVRLDESADQYNIGSWNDPKDSIAWKLKVTKPGSYKVTVDMGSPDDATPFVVTAGSGTLNAQTVNTGGWNNYKPIEVGTISITDTGMVTLTLSPKSPETWKPFNLRSVRLEPGS